MATYAHRNFCLSLKSQFPSFGPNLWGITVSDSPLGYVSWGGPPVQGPINGTIVPCATVGSAMLAPEICLPVVRQMLTVYGDTVYQRYGFADAFTPHWQGETLWVDPDVVGIDVGISLLSVENLQSGNVWRWFMRNPYIRSGMQKARFHRSIGTSLDEWNQRMAASKEDQE